MEANSQPKQRSRALIFALAALVLALGWNCRAHASSLPSFIGSFAPDTLWALLVFLVLLGIRPTLSIRRAFTIALMFSYAIEISQLYQAPWINGVRDTRLGGLLLGHGFLWSDLLCYMVGITLGALFDTTFNKNPRIKLRSICAVFNARADWL